MGLFDKLFGKKKDEQPTPVADTSPIEKTAEMLDEDLFWEIVERTNPNMEEQDWHEQNLIREIYKLTPKEIIGFRLRTDKLLYDTYTSEMWCAAYIMNGGCSDDAFEYFRCWLISRGKETYYAAKENPDTLIDEVEADKFEYDFESFWYVALEAFRQKTGKDLYEHIDDDNFKFNEANYPPMMFNWQEENPESMKSICPKLYAEYMER